MTHLIKNIIKTFYKRKGKNKLLPSPDELLQKKNVII